MLFLNFFFFLFPLSSDSSDSQGYRFLLCNNGEIICQLSIYYLSQGIFIFFLTNLSSFNFLNLNELSSFYFIEFKKKKEIYDKLMNINI